MKKWYKAKAGNHQGLIIEEKSGRTVAVSYEKEDAGLIAAAPELLEACENLIANLDCYNTCTKEEIREAL